MQTTANAWIWTVLIICGIYKSYAQFNFESSDLPSQVPNELSNLNMSDFKEMFRTKCVNVSGEEIGNKSFKDIDAGFATLAECMQEIVNIPVLQQEIKDASPRGELDVVFHKYCSNRTKGIECFDDFADKLIPCVEQDEHETVDTIKRIVRSLLNFVCYKNGDQIALFIAEEGPECFESQRDNVQLCFNNTFSTYGNGLDKSSPTSIPKLIIGEKQCGDMNTLKNCIVRNLEHCRKTTPANLVESMLNFIRNETICHNFQPSALVDSSSPSTHVISNLFIFISLLIPFFKI